MGLFSGKDKVTGEERVGYYVVNPDGSSHIISNVSFKHPVYGWGFRQEDHEVEKDSVKQLPYVVMGVDWGSGSDR